VWRATLGVPRFNGAYVSVLVRGKNLLAFEIFQLSGAEIRFDQFELGSLLSYFGKFADGFDWIAFECYFCHVCL